MSMRQSLPARVLRIWTSRVEAMPRSAQIEITNVCNLNCKMCFRHFLDIDVQHMDIELYKRIVDALEGVSLITPSGYGEPLLHPHIHEAIIYAKSKGHQVRITSNGLLLDTAEKREQLLATGLDAISFSLEDIKGESEIGHPNAAALAHIAALAALRDARHMTTPRITLQTMMLKDREEDVIDIIRWGAAHHVDRINVARFEINTLPGVARPTVAEEQALFKRFDALRRELGIQIDCPQDRLGPGWQGWLYKHCKGLLRLDDNCIRLQDFVHIAVNGDIRPCCAITEAPMGKLPQDDLRAVWRSSRYQAFRRNYKHAPWCKGCDFARITQAPAPGGVESRRPES